LEEGLLVGLIEGEDIYQYDRGGIDGELTLNGESWVAGETSPRWRIITDAP
jgi:hypothetical protein